MSSLKKEKKQEAEIRDMKSFFSILLLSFYSLVHVTVASEDMSALEQQAHRLKVGTLALI